MPGARLDPDAWQGRWDGGSGERPAGARAGCQRPARAGSQPAAADGGFALLRVPAPAGQVRVQPAWHDPHGWAALGPVVRWTQADLNAVTAWSADVVEDRDQSWDGLVWAGPVGLRRVAADPGTVAVDVCVLGDDDVPRPKLTGEEAVPVGEDTRFDYVTLDASPTSGRAVSSCCGRGRRSRAAPEPVRASLHGNDRDLSRRRDRLCGEF